MSVKHSLNHEFSDLSDLSNKTIGILVNFSMFILDCEGLVFWLIVDVSGQLHDLCG